MATIKDWLPNTVCKIKHEDGQSFLTDPSGFKLPGQIWARVTQNMNEPAYAIVRIRVDLIDTKDIETE